MTTSIPPKWVLPASIPFVTLKGRDLEECVYWLFDALGAKDLEWRTGGTGGGAADGGRDLEATFYVPSPDGEMEAQSWWIECKGRSGTLEPDAVKTACLNAMARQNLDVLVIVTNTDFSNPTRDWVKTFQAGYDRPKIKLWDQATLERQLSRHPSVVLRLFADALSVAGRLEALRERFWNRLEYGNLKALEDIWPERDTLGIGPLDRVALITNEFARGSIVERPWAGAATAEALFDTLQIGLLNLPYLWLRTVRVGDDGALINAFAYLIVAALQHTRAKDVADHIIDLVQHRQGTVLPDSVLNVLLMPILDQISEDMRDLCTGDCQRFSGLGRPDRRQDPLKDYWTRYEAEGVTPPEGPQSYVRLENTRAPCNVGFDLDEVRTCPLYEVDPALDNVAEFLAIVEQVSEVRIAQARALRKLDAASLPAD